MGDHEAVMLLREDIIAGDNTVVVVGGPGALMWINQNIRLDGNRGYSMESQWVEGPYERQGTVQGTRFRAGPVTLPGDGISVHGVKLSTVPSNARFPTRGLGCVWHVSF